MSITSTVAGVRLARVDPQPGLGARGTSRSRRRGPRRPRPRRCDASTPDGTSAATTGAPGRVDRLDHRRRPGRAARRSCRCRAARRRSAPRRSSRAGVERRGRVAGQPPELLGRVALQLLGRPDGQDVDVTPGAAQQPRRDQPVAAVVALAADDRDPARRARGWRSRARAPPPRAPSGPATGCPASRSPSGRWRASPRPRSSGSSQPRQAHSVTATAAAIPCGG